MRKNNLYGQISSRRSKISLLLVFTFFTALWNPCSCSWCLSSSYGLLHSFHWCLSSLPRIQTSDEWGRARASRFHGESQINRITRITRIGRCSTTLLYLLWSNTNCIQTLELDEILFMEDHTHAIFSMMIPGVKYIVKIDKYHVWVWSVEAQVTMQWKTMLGMLKGK